MDLIVSFLNYLKFEKRYSSRTIESYQNDLQQFHEFFCTISQLTDLTQVEHRNVREWIIHLLESNCSNRTVNRKLSALKSFYRYLLRQKLIKVSPLTKIESLKLKKRLPVFVPETNMEKLFDEVLCQPEISDYRNFLILEIFYLTGIRLSELIKLKVSDIDFPNATLKVLGKRNKERIIPITVGLIARLTEYLKFIRKEVSAFNNQEYLFITEKGEPLYPKLVYRIVTKVLNEVTTMEKRSPHVLRHTFATHMLNNGAGINEIKEILGHANLAATQVYTHNSFEKLKKIYKQAHPRA